MKSFGIGFTSAALAFMNTGLIYLMCKYFLSYNLPIWCVAIIYAMFDIYNDYTLTKKWNEQEQSP